MIHNHSIAHIIYSNMLIYNKSYMAIWLYIYIYNKTRLTTQSQRVCLSVCLWVCLILSQWQAQLPVNLNRSSAVLADFRNCTRFCCVSHRRRYAAILHANSTHVWFKRFLNSRRLLRLGDSEFRDSEVTSWKWSVLSEVQKCQWVKSCPVSQPVSQSVKQTLSSRKTPHNNKSLT